MSIRTAILRITVRAIERAQRTLNRLHERAFAAYVGEETFTGIDTQHAYVPWERAASTPLTEQTLRDATQKLREFGGRPSSLWPGHGGHAFVPEVGACCSEGERYEKVTGEMAHNHPGPCAGESPYYKPRLYKVGRAVEKSTAAGDRLLEHIKAQGFDTLEEAQDALAQKLEDSKWVESPFAKLDAAGMEYRNHVTDATREAYERVTGSDRKAVDASKLPESVRMPGSFVNAPTSAVGTKCTNCSSDDVEEICMDVTQHQLDMKAVCRACGHRWSWNVTKKDAQL